MSNIIPSLDPANDHSLAGTLRFAFDKLTERTDTMLPAKIITYDRSSNRASVQIQISSTATNGTSVSRPQIASIPVLLLGGGGFLLSFNLKAGDLGWLLANDRDISNFLQAFAESKAATLRKKSFSDAIFVPDLMKDYTISGGDDCVLQNKSGTVKVALSNTKATISAPSVEISDGGGGTMTLSGGLMSIVGDVAVVGNIQATGSITPNFPPS